MRGLVYKGERDVVIEEVPDARIEQPNDALVEITTTNICGSDLHMMGPYAGGQAEYLRVPYADFNLLTLPEGDEHENDFTMLSDIFPTGWHGTRLAGLAPGDACVVFGSGPVGLMAATARWCREPGRPSPSTSTTTG